MKVDKEALKDYEKTKIEASLKFRYSSEEYVNAKYDCIMRIMDKAKLYYKNQKH